ncbi:unnamed protein product [Arabidopsis lyrata]|nr:unnamed protein product [Arabidopsis lyrata]
MAGKEQQETWRIEPSSAGKLVKMIDKNIRNRFSTLTSGGDLKYEGGILRWFETRRNQVTPCRSNSSPEKAATPATRK